MALPDEVDVFICHASEDKEAVAQPIAERLRQLGYRVWFDNYVLRLGDNLRQVIDTGLASARFGVVILSPSFFNKDWPQRELDGLFAREIGRGNKVILPVWHKVGYEYVLKRAPMLATRKAASTENGLDQVVREIASVLEARVCEEATLRPSRTYPNYFLWVGLFLISSLVAFGAWKAVEIHQRAIGDTQPGVTSGSVSNRENKPGRERGDDDAPEPMVTGTQSPPISNGGSTKVPPPNEGQSEPSREAPEPSEPVRIEIENGKPFRWPALDVEVEGQNTAATCIGSEQLCKFSSFAGIRFGDTEAAVFEVLGNPQSSENSTYQLYVTQHHYPGIVVTTEKSKVTGIKVSGEALNSLRSAKANDPKLEFIGKSREEIIAHFGEPFDGLFEVPSIVRRHAVPQLKYSFDTSDGRSPNILFVLTGVPPVVCESISVDWSVINYMHRGEP